MFEFESKQEKYIFSGLAVVIMIVAGITFYPVIKAQIDDKLMEKKIIDERAGLKTEQSKTPKEYYAMFQCSCCGQAIDAGCCGMAEQRKEYLDQLLLDGLEDNEIMYEMVKKFGFGVLMDQSKEQEVRNYIKSKAPENPPVIGLDKTKHSFGTISQSGGIVSADFTIKNAGGSDLVIENLDTSCMCTTARLIYKGEESPEFSMSMHGNNPKDFELKISPGETALLRVYYDPMAHGKQKEDKITVTRTVTIISNDPADFQKDVRIDITQIP